MAVTPDAFTSAMSEALSGTRVPNAVLPGAPSASITIVPLYGAHVRGAVSLRTATGNIIASGRDG